MPRAPGPAPRRWPPRPEGRRRAGHGGAGHAADPSVPAGSAGSPRQAAPLGARNAGAGASRARVAPWWAANLCAPRAALPPSARPGPAPGLL